MGAELAKTISDRKISLNEADEELRQEQNISRELYESNEKLEEEIKKYKLMQIEHQNELNNLENRIRKNIEFEQDYKLKLREEQNEKKRMEQEIQSLYEQLESLKLRCSVGPSP